MVQIHGDQALGYMDSSFQDEKFKKNFTLIQQDYNGIHQLPFP